MRAFFLLCLLLCLSACTPREDYCGINPYETTSWPICAGALIQLKGERITPDNSQQHPLLAPPPGPLVAGEYNHQSYMTVGDDGIQMILLTEERVRCPTRLKVSGYLMHIARSAPERYQGWAIRVLDYACEERN